MKKILFVCDDIWHPYEVIKRGTDSFADKLKENGIELDFVLTAKDILTPEMLEEYPCIIVAKGNSINASNSAPWFEEGVTEVMPEDLRKYVENGGGYVSIHAGNVFWYETDHTMVNLLGCSFITHPPRCWVDYKVSKENPVTEGVGTFRVRDEHYQLGNFADDIDVFMYSESESGGKQIAGYTRNVGDGRLVVLSMGHTLQVWENSEFQNLFINAINYAMKKD